MAKSAPFIYQRVKGALEGMISSGRYNLGDKLPSERRLAEELGCNYHTVRKGLALLEKENVIERRVGAGTFLCKPEVSVMAGNVIQEHRSWEKSTVSAKPTMGIICPSRLNEFAAELLHQLHLRAESRGYQLTLRTVSDFNSAGQAAAKEFVDQGCRVLMLPWIPSDVSVDDLWHLISLLNIPVVLGKPFPGLEKYCYEKREVFGRATHQAIEMACNYFKGLEYKEIAFFGTDDEKEEDFQHRLMAYTRFASRNSLSIRIGLVGEKADEVDRIVTQWSTLAGSLAVVCYGDEDALRLMTAIHKQNLRIPEDIAVLGFKDIPMAARSDPPLSTIQFDYGYVAEAMLTHAEALADGKMSQADGGARQILIVRDSCGGKLRAGDQLPKLLEQVQNIDDETR